MLIHSPYITVRKPVQLSIYYQCNSLSANSKSSINVPGNISSNLLPLHMDAFGNSQTDIPNLYWNVQSNRSLSHTSLSWMIKKPTHTACGKEKIRKMSHHFSVVGIPVGDNDVCFFVPWVLIVFSEDLSIQLFNLRPLKNTHTHTAQYTKYSTHCCLALHIYCFSNYNLNHFQIKCIKMIKIMSKRSTDLFQVTWLLWSITGLKQALELTQLQHIKATLK